MSGDYNRKDKFYQMAKEQGYRSRAAFKLKELDKRFKLIRKNSRILDLGAWPGGWVQVAAERVGSEGIVVGIDLVDLEPFPNSNVHTIKGDVRDEESLQQAHTLAGGDFDLVLSDMSPKLSGIREVDNAASSACAEMAFEIATRMLKSGGALVIKLFKSQESDVFVKTTRKNFEKVNRIELDSTRNSSNEFYFVGLGFKSPTA